MFAEEGRDEQLQAEEAGAQQELADESQADEELPSDRVADLVEFIVCGLVASPDEVSLDVTDSDEGSLIEISCAEEDAGKVIGRRGRTIKAIRTIARACGQRVGTAVEVEVLG